MGPTFFKCFLLTDGAAQYNIQEECGISPAKRGEPMELPPMVVRKMG